MSRYYFNLRYAHLQVPDRRGEECSGPGDALEHGIVAILGLITKENCFRNWARWSVEIEDEFRRRVATLPFSLVLKPSSSAADGD